jgi:ribonucleoside-triphosphate reductase
MTTIVLPELDAKQTNALLDGYRKYVDMTPVPRIGLALAGARKESLDHVTAAVRAGGIICIGTSRSLAGVRRQSGKGSAALALQALSINLPRLAYESNKDETYFRAKLALAIKPSLAAMALRKKAVLDNARRGLLPAFSAATGSLERSAAGIIVNLTGARESVYSILGHDEANAGAEIMQKVLKTAAEVAAAEGKKLGEDSCSVSMVADGSGTRFATLDSDKYGKVSLLQSQNATIYSQGMTLNGKDLLSDKKLLVECAGIDKALNGGFSATVDVTDLAAGEARNAIEAALELPFFRPSAKLAVCATCGRKYRAQADKCEHCKSPHRL